MQQIYKANAIAGMLFENRLYENASKSIDKYNGGMWKSLGKGIGGMVDKTRVKLTGFGNGSSNETDMRTATAAVWVLTLNQSIWFWHEKGNQKMVEVFDKLWRAADDAWKSDNNGLKLDFKAMFDFLD
jgi:hypothetical protein